MRCFYVLKKWSSAKLSLNRDLSLNKMSLNRDCTVFFLGWADTIYRNHEQCRCGNHEKYARIYHSLIKKEINKKQSKITLLLPALHMIQKKIVIPKKVYRRT